MNAKTIHLRGDRQRKRGRRNRGDEETRSDTVGVDRRAARRCAAALRRLARAGGARHRLRPFRTAERAGDAGSDRPADNPTRRPSGRDPRQTLAVVGESARAPSAGGPAFEACASGLRTALERLPVRRAGGKATVIRLAADSGWVVLTTDDGVVGSSSVMQAKVKRAGVFVTSYAEFAKAVRSAPRNSPIEADVDDDRLRVRTAASSFRLAASDERWPLAPVGVDPGVLTPVDVVPLRSVVKAAAREDESRPELCGVFVEPRSFVATDGYRLHLVDTDAPTGAPDGGVLVPDAFVTDLLRLAAKTPDEWLIGYVGNRVTAVSADVMISSTAQAGTFPSYRDLVPDDEGATVVAVPAAFESTARQMGGLLGTGIRELRLEITPSRPLRAKGTVTLSVSGDGRVDAGRTLTTDVRGSAITFSVQPTFIADAVGHLPKDVGPVRLEVRQADKPIAIRATDPAGRRHLRVVMPIRA